MSEPVNRLKNTLIYFRQTLITTLVPFLVLLVLARYLTPGDFGSYALSQVYAVVATGLFTLGLQIGYERNYFEYADDRSALSALHNSVLGFILLSYSFVWLLTLLNIESVASIVGVDNKALLLIVLLGQSTDRIAHFYLTYYRNAEDARRYSRYMVSAAIINASVSLALVAQFEMGVLGMAIGYALSWFCVTCFMFVGVTRELSLRFDWEILKEALKISLPVTPRTLIVVMGTQSDKYILGLLGTLGGVGIYSIAYRISSVINSYMIALQNAYTPSLYKLLFSEQQSARAGLGSYLTLITYFSVLPAVVIAIFSSEIVWLLLPPEYAKAGNVLLVLALYFGIIFFGKIAGVQLIYAKKTGLTTLMAIVFAILNIVLNIPLIHYFGVLGAAFATLLTGSLYTLTGFLVAQKFCHLKWEGGAIFVIVSSLLIAGVVALLLNALVDNFALVLVVKSLLALLYGYLGIMLGFVSRENFQKVISGLQKQSV